MTPNAPSVWILEGHRPGDNAQARELASRLGGRIETKKVRFNRLYKLPNYMLGTSLVSLKKSASDSLDPPWPDLVIGIGRRSVPIARWIKKQSSGRSRLVHLGRPRARAALFDLIITTPQYGLAAAPNVMKLTLPLAPKFSVPEKELELWRRILATLPKPVIAVFIGGPVKPLSMGRPDLVRLGREAGALAKKTGGAVVVAGSPRSPPHAVETVAQHVGVAHLAYPWSNDVNPYRPLLTLADRFIVTSDSVSMTAEALGSGKPVDLFALPSGFRLKLPLHRWPFSSLVRLGLIASRREVETLMRALIARRHVGVLGQPDFERVAMPDDDDMVVRRLQAIVGSNNIQ